MPMPSVGYGGFIPGNIGGGIPQLKDNMINYGEGGLLPPKVGLGTTPPVDPRHGGINPGGGIPYIPMPTPMGGLPPGVPPVTAPGRLPESIPPRPGPGSIMGNIPRGGIMGGQNLKSKGGGMTNTGPHGPGGGVVGPVRPPMNSTVTPQRRSGGLGGVAPRPAQETPMRRMRGRGGMSMF